MAHKQTRPRPHAACRHRSQLPLPAVEDVEQRLLDVLSPSSSALGASWNGAIRGSRNDAAACASAS